MAKEEKKMTFDEYKAKYTKPENKKLIRAASIILAGGIGIIIFTCLFLICLRVYEINEYAGYVMIGVSVLIFIFAYIVPLVRITRTNYFITNVNNRTVRNAKKHNKELRESIADKMIDYNAKVEGATWYNEELVGKLAIARVANNDKDVKLLLTQIYDADVKKQSRKIIRDHALKIGLVTTFSQSHVVDTAFVAVYELNLIKDLVFLYGFRPSDAKLMKIYLTVLTNALMSYGISASSSNFVGGIVNGISQAVGKIGALSSAISVVVGSTIQGVVNATLSIIIGLQTRKYLLQEYHLQDILDEIEFEDDDETALISEVKQEVIKNAKSVGKKAQAEAA
ncbi:MAG: YcjF family protein [Bacilli bacterium]|nr:YcjF family protein [Bacilli bacterium]